MFRRFVHHLRPHGQRERGAVTVRNDRCGLIKSDPHTAGQRIGITEEPGIFVIVGRSGFAGSRQFESERSCAGGRAARQDVFH